MGKSSAKSTLAIINGCLAFMFVLTGAFYLGLYTDFAKEEGAMRWIVGAAVFLLSDLSFIIISVVLFFVSQRTPVSMRNRLYPIVAIPLFSIPPFTEIYERFTGPVTDSQLATIGLLLGIMFAGLVIYEVMKAGKEKG
ncbi:hypothetical protein MNBD_NITROSPINAE02-967 [hydrothermal vent metagenome]|uniref:Uncharacterized protein n=1 Tax=hydrothermal vent metagenome TaxID=652676 RepID=A0A3B1D4J2_9ZZZZ